MSVHPIAIYGHPALKKPAKQVSVFDNQLYKLLEEMFETMESADGIGLAANQIDVDLHIMVVDTSLVDENAEPMVLINTKIKDKKGNEIGEEGCLSLPGMRLLVPRATEITVEYQNENGDRVVGIFYDLLARVIQHEIDHLSGILISDRVGAATYAQIKNQLKEIRSRSSH